MHMGGWKRAVAGAMCKHFYPAAAWVLLSGACVTFGCMASYIHAATARLPSVLQLWLGRQAQHLQRHAEPWAM